MYKNLYNILNTIWNKKSTKVTLSNVINGKNIYKSLSARHMQDQTLWEKSLGIGPQNQ